MEDVSRFIGFCLFCLQIMAVGLSRRPFGVPIRALLQCHKAVITMQYGLYCNAIWPKREDDKGDVLP